MDAVEVHDQLEGLIARGAWRELVPFLDAPADEQLGKDVRRWYRARRAHWTKAYPWTGYAVSDDRDPAGCLRLLATALAPADKAGPWMSKLSAGWGRSPSDAFVTERAVRRGRSWCSEFVEGLSQIRIGKDDEWSCSWIARLTLDLIAADVAELPTGPAFPVAWAVHYAQMGSVLQWHRNAVERGRTTSLIPPLQFHTLTEALRADPVLPDALAMALATPRVIGIFESSATVDFELGPAVADLVREGRLDRDRVLDDAFTALTRPDTPGTQKGIAKLLAALSLGPEDLTGRLPLVQGILATSRGSVTSVLVPPTLGAVDAAGLPDVAVTVCSRPEKAQRNAVLKALTSADAVRRWGEDAVVAALRVAVEVPDEAFANRAEKALAKLGVRADREAPADVAMPELWGPPPAVAPASPVAPVEPSERGLTQAISLLSTGQTTTGGDLALDAVVRWYAADPAGCDAWASRVGSTITETWGIPHAVRMVLDHRSRTPTHHAGLCAAVVRLHGREPAAYDRTNWAVSSATPVGAVAMVLHSEVTVRLGDVPYLLSTPSRSDGSLDLEVLAARLRGYGSTPVGPADLFVALARLGSVDPARAAELPGRGLPVWAPGAGRRTFFSRRSGHGDAFELARRWVAAGGLARLHAEHEGAQVMVPAVPPPVPPAEFMGIPPALFRGRRPGRDRPAYSWSISGSRFGLVPSWGDLIAVEMAHEFDQSARGMPEWLPLLVRTSDPGVAVHHVVAATLGHADEDKRLVAVEAALVLMGRGRWSTDCYTTCCRHMLDDGQLRLARVGHAWEQLILAGGMQPLWPTAMAVLERTAAAPRKPAGLADLLAVLRRYVTSVPEPQVPAAVEVLASAGGSSKAKAEAVAFVAAVRGSAR